MFNQKLTAAPCMGNMLAIPDRGTLNASGQQWPPSIRQWPPITANNKPGAFNKSRPFPAAFMVSLVLVAASLVSSGRRRRPLAWFHHWPPISSSGRRRHFRQWISSGRHAVSSGRRRRPLAHGLAHAGAAWPPPPPMHRSTAIRRPWLAIRRPPGRRRFPPLINALADHGDHGDRHGGRQNVGAGGRHRPRPPRT
jgi:hypothetical protein